jgi:uncharacterized membrane protein HdeD (DUF308 family)
MPLDCFLTFFFNSIIQHAIQWLMFSGIILLFVLYALPTLSPDGCDDVQRTYYFGHQIFGSGNRTAVSITAVHVTYSVVCAIITIIVISTGTNQAWIWAACLGIFGIVLAIAQYSSQLWLTWRIKVNHP